MASRGSITVKIDGQYDDKDINRAIRDLNKLKTDAGGAKGPTEGLADGFKKLAVAAGAFVSVSAVADFMRDAIQQGSALEESISKVNVVFGQSAGEIQSWASESAKSFGQSQQAALEAVGTFGNLFQAFGVGRTQAKDMSKSLVELAADLASFNNTSVEDAITALRSGLSGETEPLKRYGVALTDARLKTEAFALGLYSGKGALDANAKSQAAYALIMKDTTLAQGDFLRTSDGFANTMRTLQAEVDNAKASIGVALIDAIQTAAQAFGGADGLATSIESVTGEAVLLIERIGGIVGALGALKKASEDLPAWLTSGDSDFLKNAGMNINPFVGAFNHLLTSLELAGMLGDAWNITQLDMADVAPSATNQYVRMAPALNAVGEELDGVEDSADAAAQALADAQDAAKAMLQTLSNSQTIDDFRKSLVDLDKSLKDNPRTFKGMGDAAKENRDTLRSALGDAASIAQKWVEEGKISADQYEAAYKGLSKKVVNQFVRDGFKRKDIEDFLGGEGIWTGPAKAKLTAAEKAALATAYSGFKGVGGNAAKGFAAGLEANSPLVTARAIAIAKRAEAAANKALGIESPSRVFMEIGRQTIAGFVEGMASKDADVREQARKSMLEAVGEVISDTRDQLKSALADAKAAFADFQQSVSSAIMGGIDFGQAAPQFDEAGNRVGSTFIEALREQAAQAVNFATQVKTLISQGLSKEALQQVLAAGVTAGTAIANELIAGGSTAINETNALVASTQAAADKAGLQAATNWYGAGVQSAKQTVNAFNEEMKPGGDGYERLMNRMDRLAASMNRTARITVVVDEVAGAKVKVDGARAKGGPVWPGGAFIVGERGPELFMPQVKGNILPSASMPSSSAGGSSMSGGPVYNISVSTGVGDPRQIGQQVVEYIKKFEQTNGAAWRAA